MATSQGMPTAIRSWKRQGVDSPLEPPKGLWPSNWGMGQEWNFSFRTLFFLSFFLSFFFFFLMFIHFWDREREREHARVGEGRDNPKQALCLSVQSLTWAWNPRTMRSWPEPKSRVSHSTDWATQAPLLTLFSHLLNLNHVNLLPIQKKANKINLYSSANPTVGEHGSFYCDLVECTTCDVWNALVILFRMLPHGPSHPTYSSFFSLSSGVRGGKSVVGKNYVEKNKWCCNNYNFCLEFQKVIWLKLTSELPPFLDQGFQNSVLRFNFLSLEECRRGPG